METPPKTKSGMYKPAQILPLLDEVAAAKKRAAELQSHHTLTLAEKLDIWKGADQAAANRFDVVAQAYRELLADTTKELQALLDKVPTAAECRVALVNNIDYRDSQIIAAAARLGITIKPA